MDLINYSPPLTSTGEHRGDTYQDPHQHGPYQKHDPPDNWFVFHIPEESSFKTSATDRSPIYSNGKGELPNELSLYGRVESTSTYIKSVAPDHLITVGYQGKKG
ncbi:hypothetical protein MJO29_016848, partial [Puccinia striiformis f. sp. tritici]